MLSRAVLSALRARPALAVPRASPLASTSQFTAIRFYAQRNNRQPPKKAQDNTWKSSNPIKFDESNKSQPLPVRPDVQPEFDSAAAPERNTPPSTEPSQPNAIDPDEAPAQPQKPLPDLRFGIPSTFGEEFGKEEAKSHTKEHDPNNITDDPVREPGAGSVGGRGGGELPKSAFETSTDRRRNRMFHWAYLAALATGILGATYLGRNWDTEEEEKANPEVPSGWGLGLMYNRARARVNSQMGYYTEPTFPKLLPDKSVLGDQQPPLTLVLSLEDLLVYSEWSTKTGWRTAKRPGLDYFLRYLSQYYELVIFTSVKYMDADPIIRKLDPFRIVMWPLYREATRYEKGEYVKDLSCLNRDLSKTIIIDTDPAHVKLQPENAIVLPKWKGQPRDKGLVALIPFLEYLAMLSQGSNLDVRNAIKSFEGKDIPTEFARREAKMREEFNRDLAAEKAKKPKHSLGGAVMGSLGIGKQSGMVLADGTSVSEGLAQGKMMSDLYREIGQKNYEAMDKEIRENGEKWLKEMAEEEKKLQEEAMKSMKSSAFSWLGSGAGAAGAAGDAPPEKK
ncbi:HAD-like protein [Pleomassaria siparia CBS 279.74]|uniref:Mitochondrial import inner membrane translocase subunit TIM50 n=1 Tax=Pleomassaria siparia CBS 279.74 TaxID=1314801 RepID=A0A6G1KGD0_9PLEO|nr:HAD-like protein [Pleomassaria siparia CBS 279.74]